RRGRAAHRGERRAGDRPGTDRRPGRPDSGHLVAAGSGFAVSRLLHLVAWRLCGVGRRGAPDYQPATARAGADRRPGRPDPGHLVAGPGFAISKPASEPTGPAATRPLPTSPTGEVR